MGKGWEGDRLGKGGREAIMIGEEWKGRDKDWKREGREGIMIGGKVEVKG